VKALFTAVLLALAPTAALAWSNQGHMATGAIAYDTLMATDPATVEKIVAIMAHHPDRARFDRSLAGMTGTVRTRRLFEDMARWPDDIRETPWTHPDWHYHARIVAGWSGVMTFSVGTADQAYADNLAILNDARRPAADRAIALCWLFHIVGDMHEPLHAGHRMDWRFPLTDRLGTIAYVRTGKDAPPVTFHDLWDGALDRPGSERTGAEWIARASGGIAARATSGAGSFDLWFRESKLWASRDAYVAETMLATRAAESAPVLSPVYLTGMRRLAIVRIAQAGRRLGALMSTELKTKPR
jgi:hypothetical protein